MIRRPDGCVCEPMEWDNPEAIPPIGDRHVSGDSDSLCSTCEHEEGCHVHGGAQDRPGNPGTRGVP